MLWRRASFKRSATMPEASAFPAQAPRRDTQGGGSRRGPNALHRFALEQTVTVNTTAAAGNASLLMQE